MKKMIGYFAVVFFLCLLAARLSATGTLFENHKGLELTVDFQPDSKEKGVYLCTATVKDISSNQLLAKPNLRFHTGQDVEAEVDYDGKYKLRMTVAISEDHSQVRYAAKVLQEDQLISAQTGQVRFKASGTHQR